MLFMVEKSCDCSDNHGAVDEDGDDEEEEEETDNHKDETHGHDLGQVYYYNNLLKYWCNCKVPISRPLVFSLPCTKWRH